MMDIQEHPEWREQERQHEIRRLQTILRNPNATQEERSVAQQMLDAHNPVADLPTLEDYAKMIKATHCLYCRKMLPTTIEHFDHPNGWPVRGIPNLQWLYVTCACEYEWALWKLGVPR